MSRTGATGARPADPCPPGHDADAHPGPAVGFGPRVRVATLRGMVAVSGLVAGDLLLTRDSGFRPVLWAGQADTSAPGLRISDLGGDGLEALSTADFLRSVAGAEAIHPVLILLERPEFILAEGCWTECHAPAQIVTLVDPALAQDLQRSVLPLCRDDEPLRPQLVRVADGALPGAA